jgi:hypothetical protein
MRDSLEAVINTPSILDEVQNRTAVLAKEALETDFFSNLTTYRKSI